MYLRQKYTPGSEATHCAAILVLLAMSNLVGTVVYARVFDRLRLAWEKPCLFSSPEFFEVSCRH